VVPGSWFSADIEDLWGLNALGADLFKYQIAADLQNEDEKISRGALIAYGYGIWDRHVIST